MDTGEWLSSPIRSRMNWLAPEYMQERWFKSRVTQWDYRVTRRALLEELDPRPYESILEIGCGPGTWTREVAPLCKELVAVDISEKMIAEAEQYTRGLPVKLVHSDFLAAQLDKTWDKVFSCRAVEYIFDRGLLAQKLSQLLEPGGKVVLVTKTRFSLWRGRTRLIYGRGPASWLTGSRKGAAGVGAAGGNVAYSSPGQLAAAFRPLGLVPVKVRPVVIRPPLFRRGFHEIPLIPEPLAPPFLGLAGLMYKASANLPRRLASFPLFLSESYCITFRYIGRD